MSSEREKQRGKECARDTRFTRSGSSSFTASALNKLSSSSSFLLRLLLLVALSTTGTLLLHSAVVLFH